MKKLLYIYTTTWLLMTLSASIARAQSQYVKVTGKVLQSTDSTPAVANLRYERLPYRAHSGDFTSTADGSYEFWLQLQSDYSMAISQDGYQETFDTLRIVDEGSGAMTIDFYIKPTVEENFLLENLIFARGSDVIRESSFGELDEFVRWLKDHPSLVVQLEGHTDSAGNPDANLRLSQARVDAVEKYIEKKGIDEERVRTKAFGGAQPLSDERTPEAIRANRRVEVRVINR